MSLFQLGDFILHSGDISHFKIDCDALTFEDWEAIAFLVKEKFKFSKVIGIPEGGIKLAQALEKYIELGHQTLIVDDVYTTGNSMFAMNVNRPEMCIGVVLFARGKCPSWVWPIFSLYDWWGV